MNSSEISTTEQEGNESPVSKPPLAFGSILDDKMPWWPDLPDVDRLNILSAPLEDRARILAAKYSFSLDVAVRKLAEKAELPFVETFELVENPTKRLPLRLIHAFNCLPIKRVEKKLPSKLKVLCVDDDESTLQAFRRTLGRDYEICTATNGMDGLEVFKEHADIAIVLSDMVMPEMNGPEMLELIKQYEPKTMTVLLTGHSDFELTKNAVNSGKVFKILTKPCSSSEILATLSECADKYIQMLDFRTSAEIDDGKIHLATVWPPSPRMSRWIFAVSGLKPIWYMGMPEKIIRAITENFGIGADSLGDSDLDEEGEAEVQDDLEDQNAAIIKFVNEVIQRAIVDRATDIHFEPHKETLQIRYRIDGQLVPVRVPDNLRSFQDAIISRIKIMGGINISEKRRPQGGRITFTHGQSDLDIRVSTLPTLYGESISLRLLNEKSQPLSMRELGLLGKDEANIVKVLEKPHGIVMVTGPTGSGKSTSLTAFIRRIHKPERRIMTVEDPVEYEVAGINQTQVNSEIGFTFASALREILRQDPDVIMVGEIRDRETADIAIRASLTGHLVLSTLHTNDAPGAVTRLIDMEIEPFLIASSVEMVIAQRLVRRICAQCAQPANLPEEDLRATLTLLGVDITEVIHADTVLAANGCEKCQNLGYHGRVGIFELMKMSDAIHSLIIKSASAPEIREVALSQGMTTLQACGWNQVKRGLTTLDEVIRYADIFAEDPDSGINTDLE
jgi:general secretion pathway protein E